MDARPMPTEKTGVWIQTDSIQKMEIIGIADRNIRLISFRTNSGGRIK